MKTPNTSRKTMLPALLTAALTLAVALGPAAGTALAQTAPTQPAMITMRDPIEGAFSLKMPKGWKNQAYLSRTYDLSRSVVTSLSPDGKTLLFSGDPRLPSYYIPNEMMNENSGITPFMNPLIKFSPYVPTARYFPEYVRNKFGKLPGFRIISVGPNPGGMRLLEASRKRVSVPVNIEAVLIRFDYTDSGKPMHALLNGTTMSNESIWTVEVSGVTTPGNPVPYNDLLLRMAESFQVDPQWKAKQQALHEQRMARLKQDHQNQMATFNASNERHALRMKAIQAQGDTSMKNWYEKQAQSDATHRNFLNYITEENTVVSPSGKTYQVDNSHQRYYVNKSDNTYIGTDSFTSRDDLRSKAGVNPDDYVEAKIKKR